MAQVSLPKSCIHIFRFTVAEKNELIEEILSKKFYMVIDKKSWNVLMNTGGNF